MPFVIDATEIFQRRIPADVSKDLFTSRSVYEEILDEESRIYLSIHGFRLTVLEPESSFVARVALISKLRHLLLSKPDIELVALCLQLSEDRIFDSWVSKEMLDDPVELLSGDLGVRTALEIARGGEASKRWMFLCVCCRNIFDESRDFCKECGNNSLSRVSVREEDGEIVPNLKKGYVFKPKVIKDKTGKEIIGEEQKGYQSYKYHKEKLNKLF